MIDIQYWNKICGNSGYDIKKATVYSSNHPSYIINQTYYSTAIIPTTTCYEVVPFWWSSAGTMISILLIECDRFLAIRYPLLYPEMMSDERSIFACIISQLGCLCLVLLVRHINPTAFDCEQMVGDVIIQVTTLLRLTRHRL